MTWPLLVCDDDGGDDWLLKVLLMVVVMKNWQLLLWWWWNYYYSGEIDTDNWTNWNRQIDVVINWAVTIDRWNNEQLMVKSDIIDGKTIEQTIMTHEIEKWRVTRMN